MVYLGTYEYEYLALLSNTRPIIFHLSLITPDLFFAHFSRSIDRPSSSQLLL